MAIRTQPVAKRKRPQPQVTGGVANSYEDKDCNYSCPVCFKMIEEPYMTKCGHSFCHACLLTSFEKSNRCPKCSFIIEKIDDVFPNFLLGEIIAKQRLKIADTKRLKLDHLATADSLDLNNLDVSHIDHLLQVLNQKKEQLEMESKAVQSELLKEFLTRVHERKLQQIERLGQDVLLLKDDIHTVEENISGHKHVGTSHASTSHAAKSSKVEPNRHLANGSENNLTIKNIATSSNLDEGFNSSTVNGKPWIHTSMASRRKKIEQHFDDLEEVYFSIRQSNCYEDDGSGGTLEEFSESLSKFTRYSSFRTLATLNYHTDIYNSNSIVSSIEFDRDCEYFAIAGVTKKIKVFEYGSVIRDQVDMHYPVTEMLCNSKISSVIWSSYHKGMLASSDYEGTVNLWDAFTGVKTRVFQEHEKRCWSVDFNRMDPKLLASGSDDSKVKLWHTNTEHSVASLEVKANVCCVKFNPESRFNLAFGSADHCIHYYDLRNSKEPLMVLKGHRKAVSYAKFVNANEIVSASTDSQLKLWSLSRQQCMRTFKGHSNEKNFVGLATDGDYIACGSENNSMYIYYKGLSKQLLTYKFDTVRSVLQTEKKEEESSEFVSAVCWKLNSNVIIAANSQGTIKVLELV